MVWEFQVLGNVLSIQLGVETHHFFLFALAGPHINLRVEGDPAHVLETHPGLLFSPKKEGLAYISSTVLQNRYVGPISTSCCRCRVTNLQWPALAGQGLRGLLRCGISTFKTGEVPGKLWPVGNRNIAWEIHITYLSLSFIICKTERMLALTTTLLCVVRHKL